MGTDNDDGLGGIESDRRGFLRKMAGGAAVFAAPAVVSITLDDGGDKAEASGEDVGRALYEDPPVASLTATKSASTVAGVCGTGAPLTVPAGTTVFYCYTATNTGNVDLTSHTIVDDKIGTVTSGLALVLKPGQSQSVFSTGQVLTATVTNTAVWTATAEIPDTVAGAATATATAQANTTVTVVQPEAIAPRFTG